MRLSWLDGTIDDEDEDDGDLRIQSSMHVQPAQLDSIDLAEEAPILNTSS
jgi:hypothetical protein